MVDLLQSAISVSMASHLRATNRSHLIFPCHHSNPSKTHRFPFLLSSLPNSRTQRAKSWKLVKPISSAAPRDQSALNDETLLSPVPKDDVLSVNSSSDCCNKTWRKNRVLFLDVNSLCFKKGTRSLHYFAHWVSLFFSKVSLNDPVIAVLDGNHGNEYRRKILPSYKANRRGAFRAESFSRSSSSRSEKLVRDVLQKCNVPVVKIDYHEADDVVATLVHQVLLKGYRAVIASPDKDFRQLISEDVEIVAPVPELNRWYFYTIKDYIAQYKCDPQSDLSLRCILGDEADGVPGLQHLVPGFGQRTAIKLMKKHGCLENLLNAASVRTVGREYVQKALTKYGDLLRKNYEVLSLKSDVDIQIEKQWLCRRDERNDWVVLSSFNEFLSKTQDFKLQN